MPFRFYLFAALLLWSVEGRGQKEDYVWLAGYFSHNGFSTAANHWFGISQFDFNSQPVVVTRDSMGINFDRSNASISDKDGNLLFSCNGVRIHNWLDQKVENGDSLAWGFYLIHLNGIALQTGSPHNLLMQVLPHPYYNGVYDLFYIQLDTFTNYFDLRGKNIMRSRLDMNANNGLGRVTQKDVVELVGSNSASLAATRHANGRDWWLCTDIANSNCYDIFLYEGSDSTKYHHVDCGGEGVPAVNISSMKFSPDGSKYVQSNTMGGVNIFDFDRCTGTLSLREHIDVPEFTDSAYWWPTGAEFSPDSRFAYVFCSQRIFQFDTWANPIANSRVAVGVYAGFNGPYPVGYYHGQLAPDGKIYVNGGNGNYYIGVIDNPNGQGTNCNFLDHSIQTPTFIIGLPYYPNYRLGALPGSPCDTITSSPQTPVVTFTCVTN